jgi:capsule polysaccharide modification protein KpsS
MSQFIVFKGSDVSLFKNDNYLLISVSNADKFIQYHVSRIFKTTNMSDFWTIISRKSKDTESVFLSCQDILLKGTTLYNTKLGKYISKLLNVTSDAAFWYGDDSNDLPKFSDCHTLLEYIEMSLKNDSGEIYALWEKC